MAFVFVKKRDWLIFFVVVRAVAVDEVNALLYWAEVSMIRRAPLMGVFDNITDIFDAGKLHLM